MKFVQHSTPLPPAPSRGKAHRTQPLTAYFPDHLLIVLYSEALTKGYQRCPSATKRHRLERGSDGYRGSGRNHPRTVRVIHYALDLLTNQGDLDDCIGCPGFSAASHYDHHRFAIHFPDCHLPGHRPALVIAKIRRV